MKRFFPLMFALLLCIGFSACAVSPKEYGIDTIHNAKTGDAISLGMSREAVERQLGKGAPFDYEAFWKQVEANSPNSGPFVDYEKVEPTTPLANNKYTYGSGEDYIFITYKNDAVLGFGTTSEDVRSNWVLLDGITHGSSLEAVTKYYGEVEKQSFGTLADGKSYCDLTYCFDSSGKQVKGLVSSSIIIILFADENTNKVVAFGVDAYDPTPTIDRYKSIFENKDKVQIFDENNKDITQEVFLRHQSDCEKSDWQAIEDGLSNLHVSIISGP